MQPNEIRSLKMQNSHLLVTVLISLCLTTPAIILSTDGARTEQIAF